MVCFSIQYQNNIKIYDRDNNRSNKYRIQSVDYAVDNTSVTAVPCSSFTDFELIWDGLTFEDFTNTALDPDDFPLEAMKFNEFTIIPLMEAEPIV